MPSTGGPLAKPSARHVLKEWPPQMSHPRKRLWTLRCFHVQIGSTFTCGPM